jgi:REP element-mobilizing transposase RayT
MRARREVVSLRRGGVVARIKEAIAAAHKDDFRILHFSVQANHIHLMVEASDQRALTEGMRGFAIRMSHAVNRKLGRRGQLVAERYHAKELKTPREVRNAIIYIHGNNRRHGDRELIDACSSAPWFDGFRAPFEPRPDPPTAAPRTWLARVGWRRRGLIDLTECPRAGPSRRGGTSVQS